MTVYNYVESNRKEFTNKIIVSAGITFYFRSVDNIRSQTNFSKEVYKLANSKILIKMKLSSSIVTVIVTYYSKSLTRNFYFN